MTAARKLAVDNDPPPEKLDAFLRWLQNNVHSQVERPAMDRGKGVWLGYAGRFWGPLRKEQLPKILRDW